MKSDFYKISLLLILTAFSFKVYSQASVADSLKIDSLKKILPTEKEDTNKVNTLNELAKKVNDLNIIMQYAKEAFSLSEKLNFKNGAGNALWNIGYSYFHQANYLEALKFFYASLKIMNTIDNKHGVVSAYRAIGDCYYSKNNRSEGMKNYHIALDIAQKINDKPELILLHLLFGGYYFDEGNYPESIKNYYSGLKLAEEINSKHLISMCLDNLAYDYYYQGDYSQELKYALKTLELNKELNDKTAIANSYSRISDAYFQLGNYEKSLQMDITSVKMWQEMSVTEKASFGIAYVYNSIGEIYAKQGDLAKSAGKKDVALNKFREAKINFLVATTLFKPDDQAGISTNYIDLGNIDVKLDNIKEAKDYLEKGLQISIKVDNKENLKTVYSYLAIVDSIQGNYKQAFDHYKQHILYRDSLTNEEATKKTVQTQMQYEFDKKEVVAKAVQDKKDADAKRIKNQQYFAIAALGIIVLAVIIIALIQFRNNKQKQKANILLERQKQKVEITLTELKSTQAQLIQSEKMASLGELTAGIAHEIQNPLNFVNNFSEVNKELVDELQSELKAGNAEEAIAISNDIKDNEEKINHHGKRADAIVKNMLQHSRSSTGVKEPTDINALADEYLRLSYHGMRAKDKSFNAEIKTDFDTSIGKINIVPQDIGRVLLNLYNNAFYTVNEKAKQQTNGYEPTISVSTKKINNSVEIAVKDNGNGIPQNIIDKIFQPFFTTKPTGEGTGLGLSLSYDIIKAHGGEIKVKTVPDKETTFFIYLPAF